MSLPQFCEGLDKASDELMFPVVHGVVHHLEQQRHVVDAAAYFNFVLLQRRPLAVLVAADVLGSVYKMPFIFRDVQS